MKKNYSIIADCFKESHLNNITTLTKEELVASFTKDIETFKNGDHETKAIEFIQKATNYAMSRLFGSTIGFAKLSETYISGGLGRETFEARVNTVSIVPNYVHHNGQPFVIGPHITHTYTLSFVVSIPTRYDAITPSHEDEPYAEDKEGYHHIHFEYEVTDVFQQYEQGFSNSTRITSLNPVAFTQCINPHFHFFLSENIEACIELDIKENNIEPLIDKSAVAFSESLESL